MIGNYPAVLYFNGLFLKLNWLICNLVGLANHYDLNWLCPRISPITDVLCVCRVVTVWRIFGDTLPCALSIMCSKIQDSKCKIRWWRKGTETNFHVMFETQDRLLTASYNNQRCISYYIRETYLCAEWWRSEESLGTPCPCSLSIICSKNQVVQTSLWYVICPDFNLYWSSRYHISQANNKSVCQGHLWIIPRIYMWQHYDNM